MKQNILFENLYDPSISITEAATSLGVSTASIRNWIKTGYLQQTDARNISIQSFENFKTNVAGQEKLIARANKSQKDTHDHLSVSDQFKELLLEKDFNCATIGDLYQESLSNAYRNQEGIYYTPDWITERFFSHLPANSESLTFCDPCCGSGNFILAAIEHGILPENVFGFDIDPVAVEITKRRILEQTGFDSPNIHCADFLELSLQKKSPYFDVIFTNPPWGKKLSKAHKQSYAKQFSAGSSFDTCSLFFFAALLRLKKNGFLGFLLPDAFFNVATFADARRKALSLSIKALMDFGKPFKGLLTKAKGILVQNQINQNEPVCCEGLIKTELRTPDSFCNNPKSILNFSCTAEEEAVITHLYEMDHLKLAGRARYGLGIVTGNNKKYCVTSPRPGYLPVYKGADLQKNHLKAPSTFIPDDLSLYQQVAPVELFRAPDKLIYRFISSDLVFHVDTTQSFFLNSVNMLIPDEDFPINSSQLCQLLNSKVMNWLFQSIFETHKILRSDIESLPIHTQYFEQHNNFDEISFTDFLGLKENTNGTFSLKE